MIEIHNLTICHRYDLRKIIDDFTLTVKPTDKIAIIGEEGNGKSTLLKCIVDSQLVESYCEVQGTIQSKNERIGYLPKNLNISMQRKLYTNTSAKAMLFHLRHHHSYMTLHKH